MTVQFDRDQANTRKVVLTDDQGTLLDGGVRAYVWNGSSWVRMAQPDTADDLTSLFAYTGNNVEYIGMAAIGSATSAALWAIRKLAYSGDNVTSIKWASASSAQTFIWDDRSTYTYS